jgi:hypothetical protein
MGAMSYHLISRGSKFAKYKERITWKDKNSRNTKKKLT